MKRFLIYLILSVLVMSIIEVAPAQAGLSGKKDLSQNSEVQYVQKSEKEIKNILLKQVELSNKQDWETMQSYYAPDYRNSDAFDKNTTFAIIRENYTIYDDLKISLKINSIDVKGKFAVADVNEFATKDNLKRDDIEYKGKLNAKARTVYYFENINGKWLITSEYSVYENNIITFGETDYSGVVLEIPMSVPAGEQYTATLKIDNLPNTAVVMGSITKSDAIYPIPVEDDSDDSYRIFEDTKLERILYANKDNINEYVSGTLGITRSKPLPNGDFKLYLSGLALVMGKVNVIPQNNRYTPYQTNETETSEKFLKTNIEPDDILPDDNYVKERESVDD